MKFVALALAVLLAAGKHCFLAHYNLCILLTSQMNKQILTQIYCPGCQGDLWQADAPTQYEHIRAGVVTYLTQLKASAHKAINSLDDAEFKDYK